MAVTFHNDERGLSRLQKRQDFAIFCLGEGREKLAFSAGLFRWRGPLELCGCLAHSLAWSHSILGLLLYEGLVCLSRSHCSSYCTISSNQVTVIITGREQKQCLFMTTCPSPEKTGSSSTFWFQIIYSTTVLPMAFDASADGASKICYSLKAKETRECNIIQTKSERTENIFCVENHHGWRTIRILHSK